MSEYRFDCLAIDFEHNCSYENSPEPDHSDNFLTTLNHITESLDKVEYKGAVKSSHKHYRISSNFYKCLTDSLNKLDYVLAEEYFKGDLEDILDVKLEGVFKAEKDFFVVEVKKSKKKSFWYDYVKFMSLIGLGIVDYGILFVPRNYIHKNEVLNMFDKARFYRSCLVEYARADYNIINKIAIVGYTQQYRLEDTSNNIDTEAIIRINDDARQFYKKNE
jgi:hypothetical protein